MNKFALTLLLTSTTLAVMAETDTVPPETWKCTSCPQDDTASRFGSVNLGLGWLSNDSFAYGQSTGMVDNGVYLLLDGEYRSQKGAERFEVTSKQLGLESRSMTLSQESQGRYRIQLQGQSIPAYGSDTAYTPYSGVSDLAPGPGWIPGNTSANFSNLSEELMKTDWYSNRKTVSLDFRYQWNPSLESEILFSRSSKTGKQPLGLMLGSDFFGRAAHLLAPIQYETKAMSLSLQRKKPTYQWNANYALSQFFNPVDSIRWENLFSEPVGVNNGQAALPPDNQFHQLSWQASYLGMEKWLYAAAVSYGQTQQNETFLPGSIHPTEVASVSANSLQGKIVASSALVNALYHHSQNQSYDFRFQSSEQDNQSSRVTTEYVTADTLLYGKRSSRPYSFRNQRLSAKSRTKLWINQEVTVAADYHVYDRTYQSNDHGTQGSAWLRYQHKPKPNWEYNVKLLRAKRNGSSYTALEDLDRPENSVLRKYNLAGRTQSRVLANNLYQITNQWTINVGFDAAKEFYDANLGLQEAEAAAYNIDLAYRFSDKLNTNYYWNSQRIQSTQRGGNNSVTWNAEHSDSLGTHGLNLSYEWWKDKLYVDFDALRSNSIGRSHVVGTAYPDLRVARTNYKLSIKYNARNNLTLHGFYEQETYTETDWALDGLTAASLDNLLSLGEVPPDYNIGLIGVSLRYDF